MTTIARNRRIESLRKSFGWNERRTDMPVAWDETRHCTAYDSNHNPIGTFDVLACDCLSQDTITWRGWFWNLQMMAECGSSLFPHAATFGFDANQRLSGIRAND